MQNETYALVGDHSLTCDAEHIASWHPAVALAAADWLDAAATNFGGWGGTGPLICHAVAVARAYLGEDE